jgi:predicted metal-dependent phosphoesterase TrpH
MRTQKSNRFWRIFLTVIIPILITTISLINYGCEKAVFHIENPYEDVDWTMNGQYKANFHTHTTKGGAGATPEIVIDGYKSLGYSILALTDHDTNGPIEPTWPWQAFDRDPEKLNMVAIQGNEISEVNHMVSLFNDYGNSTVSSEKEALEEIGRRGGLAVFNHPGRYKRSVEWYTYMYRLYDHLIALEIINKDNRYPDDRKTWDAILTQLAPERSVWGVSNDDMHQPKKDIGFSWNVIILPELTKDLVRQAIEQGCFYFVHTPFGHEGPPVPVIESINVDEQSGTIEIEVSGHDYITWVSQGNIIHKGDQLNLNDLPEADKYVRVEICTVDSIIVGTQPFIIQRPEKEK